MSIVSQSPDDKHCPKCKEWFPRTQEFWNKNRSRSDGYQSYCKQCDSAISRNYRKENAEKVKERIYRYIKENPEKVKERQRRYYQKNLERIKKYHKDYHEKNRERERESNRKRNQERKEQYKQSAKERHLAHPEKKREYQKRYYDRHHDKESERKILYRQQNNEQMRAKEQQRYKENPIPRLRSYHKRKALKKGSNGSYTKAELQAQFESQQGRCYHCGKWLVLGNGRFCHVDHWIPLSKGGSNNIENIRLLCPHCNLSKNDKLPCEWNDRYCK